MATRRFLLSNKISFLAAAILLVGGIIFLLHQPYANPLSPVVNHNTVLGSAYDENKVAAQPSLLLPASSVTAIASRDAQRVSDLAQLQADIQLYYNKCGYFPGVAQPGSVCGPFAANNSYFRLSAALAGSGLGIANMPNDPSPGRNYFYSTNAAGSSYTLGAQLEDVSNSLLQQSLDASSNGLNCRRSTGVYCVKS
jgi:hypothetical protein